MAELTKDQLLEYVKKQKLKIKKLETEISTLKEKAPETSAGSLDTGAHRAELDALERQLQSKDAEIASLSKQLEDAEDEKIRAISLKNAELESQRAEAVGLKEQIAALNIASFEQQTAIDTFRDRALAADRHAASLEGKLAAVMSGLESSQRLCKNLEAQLADLKNAQAGFATNSDATSAALAEMKAAFAAAQASEREAQAALATLTASHASQAEDAARLEAEVVRSRSLLQAAEGEKARVAAELAMKHDEVTRLQASLRDKAVTPTTAPPTSTATAATTGATTDTAGAGNKKKGKNNKRNKGKGASAEPVEAVDAGDAEDTNSLADAPSSAEVMALEAQLAEAVARESSLRNQLNSVQGSLDESQALERSFSEQTDALRGQLASAMAAGAKATAEAQDMRNARTELEQKLAQLTQELQAVHAQNAQGQAHGAALEQAQQLLQERDRQLEAGLAAAAQVEQDLAAVHRDTVEAQTNLQLAEGKVQALTATLVGAQAEVATLSEQTARLSSEVSALQTALANATSGSATASDALRADLAAKVNELQAMAAAQAALEAEVVALKDTAAQADSMNKKLTAKLKQKMKECTDLTADLAALKETASKAASTEETSKTAASQRVQQLEGALATQRSEWEAKTKAQNDALIAGEEKLSGILREKNKLQEDLFAALNKAEQATKDAHGFKTERDQARQQYLDIETKLQALSASSREKIEGLTTKVGDLNGANAKFAAQLSAANEALALSAAEVTTLKDSAGALVQVKEKLKAQTAMVESLKQQLAECKTDSETKAEAANDRIKKLKALLTKVNALAQEKETKLTQLQTMNDRAKKFNIVTRIGIVPPQDPTGAALEWCLIYEHRTTGTAAAKGAVEEGKEGESPAQYRWIEERAAHKWVAEGSTLVGSWPHPIQETWAAEMAALRQRLEAERDDVTARLEDVSAQFQTYKVRAQTALKRIGTEDRNEKLKAQEAENAEIERLRNIIQSLQEKETEFALAAATKDREIVAKEQALEGLRRTVEEMEAAAQDADAALKAAERKISLHQKEIETLQEDARVMKDQYEQADRTNRERRVQQLRAEEEAAKRLVTKANAEAAVAAAATAAARTVSPPADSESLTVDSTDSARPASPRDGHDGAPQRGLSRGPSQNITSPRARPIAVEAALTTDLQDGSDSKLLLFQQADSVLRDSILVLRKENAQLMVEINELKNDLGLREDQVTALKTTIRDLESSLCREKEFNAENRRINADYLVNILRNFLMSTEPSERAKLVPVLCQILHLRPDESKIIAEKWAVRGGGLVGWLLPQRPAVPTGPMRYQAHATGMSIDRGDAQQKSSAGDLTYDPVTGGGIDVNGY